MKKIYLLIFVTIFACKSNTEDSYIPHPEEGNTTESASIYYFIRHAEKDTSNPDETDPELLPEGFERAEKWGWVFKDIPFDLIYSSKYRRTKSTAQKIAETKQKEVQIYDASQLNDEDFQEKTKGKTVLVVGHSNSNPQFINYILGEKKYEDIPDEESGSLYIVTVLPNGYKHAQVLYFN